MEQDQVCSSGFIRKVNEMRLNPSFWDGVLFVRNEEYKSARLNNDFPRMDREARIITLVEDIKTSLICKRELGSSFDEYCKVTKLYQSKSVLQIAN